ncbi:MAG: helix-turn-helix transcriptional regulator [Bacteroidales bacterium]|nr:helix-turn-helix transcriptional regulator [Bacteroidales bacterium]
MLLKELLKSKGLKQNWLASKIWVSEVTVCNWCAGNSVSKKSQLQKISELLEVSVKTIINKWRKNPNYDSIT